MSGRGRGQRPPGQTTPGADGAGPSGAEGNPSGVPDPPGVLTADQIGRAC